MAVEGGQKLARFLREARAASRVKRVDVGFWASSKYDDGTPVTNVAAWNEFGTERVNADGERVQHVPERPFFRNALSKADERVLPVLRALVDPATMAVTRPIAERLGQAMQAEIQTSIVKLKDPPNADATKDRKGSSNPLVDTGFMLSQVTYKVEG